MRIGIDIDDTLTDIKDKLTNAAKEYAISLNKNVENKNHKIVDIYNNLPSYESNNIKDIKIYNQDNKIYIPPVWLNQDNNQ